MTRVLIVDDSPAQLYSLRKIVEQAGHETLVADCGELAIELAADEHPEVILMDIVMPGMNGFQATRKLVQNENTSDIPVILVSTRTGETDRVWGIRQGATDYVTKPVNPDTLLSAISGAMAA
ncbi:response regulator [Elongatibacter sediminis]|uniref:Response regulator n=1 Tax=Elongatibacter sediminis TaxID=3119006 RepID=A0AAW9R5D6_9GAMM